MNNIVLKYFLLLQLIILPCLLTKGQNLIYNGNFDLSSAGWTTSCSTVEAWGFETTYGGTNPTNHVAEIDDQACMHQDVCIIPGLSYVFNMTASCRTAGGPNPCMTQITISGLNAGGSIVSTFVSMIFTRTNTVFALTPVTGIPTITVPPCSGIVMLRVELTDATPGPYSTLGMIVDSLSLTISGSPITLSGPTSICENTPATYSVSGAPPCLTYSWNFGSGSASGASTATNSWSTSGMQSISVTIGNGTCSVLTLNYNTFVNPAARDTISATVCSSTPYVFNGVTEHTTGVYSDTFPTSGGCDSIITLLLTVNPTPSPPAATNQVYCQFDMPAPLNATGMSLQWFGPGFTAGYSAAPTPSTTNTGTTVYYVTQTVLGCASDSATISVTVKPKPSPPIPQNYTYCQGSTAVALSAEGSQLQWYTSATSTDFSTTAPIPSTTVPGVTTWYVSQYVNGCESDLSPENVTINPTPSFSITASHTDVCLNDTVSLAYSGTIYGPTVWKLPSDATIATGTLTDENITVQFSNGGTQSVYLTATDTIGGCSATNTVALNIVPQPTAQIYAPNTCPGDTVIFSLLEHSADAYSFAWLVDSSPINNSGSLNIVSEDTSSNEPYEIIWHDTGSHTITMYASTIGGCRSENYTSIVHVAPSPDASFTFNETNKLCIGDSVLFQASDTRSGNIYTWAPTSTFIQNNTAYIQAQITDEHTDVTLTVVNSYGCKATNTVPLNAQLCCIVAFPSAFTPNGDGLNDYFSPIVTGNYHIHQFTVENRWGQIVYQSTNGMPAWNGTFNGIPQDMGTYNYFVTYDCGENLLTQKGNVTLIR